MKRMLAAVAAFTLPITKGVTIKIIGNDIPSTLAMEYTIEATVDTVPAIPVLTKEVKMHFDLAVTFAQSSVLDVFFCAKIASNKYECYQADIVR